MSAQIYDNLCTSQKAPRRSWLTAAKGEDAAGSGGRFHGRPMDK